MKLKDMTPEQRNQVIAEACKRLQSEFDNPRLRSALNEILRDDDEAPKPYDE